MAYSGYLRSAVCITALVASGAAQADVTAAEVWENWKSQLALYGDNNITFGAEDASGDTLVVRDLSVLVDDGELKVSANMGDVTFTELGDGTVSMTMVESYPVTFESSDGSDDAVLTLLVTQSNLEIVVGGDSDALNYAVTVDNYGIEFQDFVENGETFTGDAKFTMNDISGTYTSDTADLRKLTYEVDVESVDVLVDIQIPESNGEYVVGSAKIAGMAMQGDMAIPEDVDFENPDDLFVRGMSVAGSYNVGSGTYIFDINADGTQAAGSASTGSGELSVEMNSQNMAYKAETNDLAASITSSDLPFPIEVSLGTYGLGFEAPVGKSETASDFGLNIDLVDLTINDEIWNMFDPGTVLSRDPATVQFDVSGKAKPLFDLLDPTQTLAIAQADIPFELENLSVNSLRVALAGALMTGSAEFTFDNTDLESFDGFPRPEGDAIVEVSGLNGLMDNLVAMGLVPEEQIAGGRLMLGLFARTTGDDQLETNLEVNSEGHVLVNGQRMR